MDSTKLPETIETTPNGQKPAASVSDDSQNIIPDEVPRKDGPGGE